MTCALLDAYEYPKKYNSDDDAIKLIEHENKYRETNILIVFIHISYLKFFIHYAINDDVIFIMMLHI
jgi:hypothetical protein